MGEWDPDVLGVMMASFAGTEIPSWLGGVLDAGLASVVLFGHNTPDPETTARLSRSIHARASECVIAIDEEGGDVTRIQSATGSSLPTAWALGEVDDPGLTRRSGRALGEFLAACDIDLALSPVLDVSTDPANPVIGTRAFGDTPGLVATHAGAFAAGLTEAGVGTCGKHFPGHGASTVDSHVALPFIELGAQEFEQEHLAPWSIAGELDSVMTAHVAVPTHGKGPASIAPWSRPLLDSAAGGVFQGLVITDALDMGAVARDPGYGEAAVQALEAGADLLCLGTTLRRDDLAMLREAHEAVLRAVLSGRISRTVLHTRAQRTRRLLRSLRARRRRIPVSPLARAVERLDVVGAEGAARAVRSSRPRLDPAPVELVDLRGGAQYVSQSRPEQLSAALRERGMQVEVTEHPGRNDRASQLVILTSLPRSVAEEGRRLSTLLDQRPDAVVVHTGVPAAAPDHPRLVYAHGAGRAMMRAAADVMVGGPS